MEILHKKFTYINPNNLKNILQNTTTKEQYNNNKNYSDCKIYLRTKFPNKRYKESTNKIQYNYLKKISSNVYGLFKYPIYNNKRYFITFLDKKSRLLKVRLLANKTKVL